MHRQMARCGATTLMERVNNEGENAEEWKIKLRAGSWSDPISSSTLITPTRELKPANCERETMTKEIWVKLKGKPARIAKK